MRQYGLMILVSGLVLGRAICAETNQVDVKVFFTNTVLTPAEMVVIAKAELAKSRINVETNACTLYISFAQRACVVQFEKSLGGPHKVIFNEEGKIAQVNPAVSREITDPEWRILTNDEKNQALDFLKKHERTTERIIQEGTPPPQELEKE